MSHATVPGGNIASSHAYIPLPTGPPRQTFRMELVRASLRVLGLRATIVLGVGTCFLLYGCLALVLKRAVGNGAFGMLLAVTLIALMQWFALRGYGTLGIGPQPLVLPLTLSENPAERIRFVCISDTHGKHRSLNVPHGDVLIHTGDFCNTGTRAEVEDFNAWLQSLPHVRKLVVCGNHDLSMDAEFLEEQRDVWDARSGKARPEGVAALLTACTILHDDLVEIDGVRIYGTPIQPQGMVPGSFMRSRAVCQAAFAKIPANLDILLTHCPPWGFGDRSILGSNAGCEVLREEVERKMPTFHIFGHIHEGYGMYVHPTGMIFLNCASSTFLPWRLHDPVVFDIGRTPEGSTH